MSDCNEDACSESSGLDSETLRALGTGLLKIEKENEKIEERSLSDLIRLDQYLRARKAACEQSGNAWGVVSMTRAIPPDSAGIQ